MLPHRRTLLPIAAALLTLACAATQVALVPEAGTLRSGTSPPPSPNEELGAVTAQHGGGCGAYGTRGNYEGAYALLKNKAASLGANYVQILRMNEPHLVGRCFQNAYIIEGMAYRVAPSGAAPPAALGATSQAPPAQRVSRVEGLNGTYSGDITGNAQGRVFTARITFTLVQSGEQVIGTWTTTNGGAGTVKGVITEAGIREWTARQFQPCAGEFGGVAVIEASGAKLTGSYVGSDCQGSVTASFAVVRQQ